MEEREHLPFFVATAQLFSQGYQLSKAATRFCKSAIEVFMSPHCKFRPSIVDCCDVICACCASISALWPSARTQGAIFATSLLHAPVPAGLTARTREYTFAPLVKLETDVLDFVTLG